MLLSLENTKGGTRDFGQCMHDVSGRKLEAGRRLEAVESHLGEDGENTHTVAFGRGENTEYPYNNYRRRLGLIPYSIIVLIYFCSLFSMFTSLYWCYWHKLDSLRKLCATMKQPQANSCIGEYSHITS
jgi:hypothetical protein